MQENLAKEKAKKTIQQLYDIFIETNQEKIKALGDPVDSPL